MAESGVQYSIVVPVFNSKSTILRLVEEIHEVMEAYVSFELILVDDCSTDGTWDVLKASRTRFKKLRIVRLSNNFGQAAATLCGIYRAKGKSIITIDDDLQYPPYEIPKLIDHFNRNDFYMVLGIPKAKKQPMTYLLFEKLIRLFFMIRPIGHLNGKRISSSFRIFKSDLNFSKDHPLGRVYSIHMATLLINPTFIGEIAVDHIPSQTKKSRYSFYKRFGGFIQLLLEYNINLMSWVKWPLLLATLAILMGLVFGWLGSTPLLQIILIILLTIIIIGQWILAFYLKQINARQLGLGPYLVMEEHGE